MTTTQDQQSRAAYEDGKWYWVEREGWHGEPPTIAPACYKAECDAWYSYIFSGISTPYLKVLEPCELQAARALPARGVDTMLDTPADMEPVAWLHINRLGASQTFTSEPPPGFKAQCAPLYTAAQVQAMGRVPPGFVAVPVERTEEMKRAAMELLLDGLDIYVNGQDQIVIETDAPRRLWKAFLAAAPQPPAAQEGDLHGCELS